MKIFTQIFLYLFVFISFKPMMSLADKCQVVVQKIYDKKLYFPTYQEMTKSLGKPTEGKTIRQIQYQWDDFFLITRNGKIVQKYGELPKKLHTDKYRYKNLKIRDVLKTLGEPEEAKKSNLLQVKWQCKDTPSFVSVTLNDNNKIESYNGEYCRKSNSPLCSKYKREGLILLAE